MDFDLKVIGEAILYSSIQFAIGSVEMSSKFSVKNFSKDQETLQNAADALKDYIKIGLLWTIGVAILMYCSSGIQGAIAAVVSNFLIMYWTYDSYMKCFEIAAKTNKLIPPKLI
jgi:hypothetical protein